MNGWLVGTKGTISFTNGGGSFWSSPTTNPKRGTNATLNAVSMLLVGGNKYIGWIVGGDATTGMAVILSTSDGLGTVWSDISSQVRV